MEKVDKDTAKEDLERFMSDFKLDPIKRELMEKNETIAKCEKLIVNGMLIVNDDNTLKYKLIEHILDDKGETKLSELTFIQRRTRVEDVSKFTDERDSDIEKAKKLMRLLTGVNTAFIGKISGDDMGYLNDIAAFFLPAS